MTTSSRSLAPISIYVLFHPDSDESRRLAHALHDWFRLRNDDGDRTESGLPIWFRSQLSSVAPGQDPTVSPPIAWGGAEANIVVVLADRHMVADRSWRYALEALCAESAEQEAAENRPDKARRNLILPIEVHWSLYQLGFLTENRNAIRIGDPIQDELHETDKDRWHLEVDDRARHLRRAVTEAIARELVLGSDANRAPERLSVFLSHAKRDGLEIAETLRDSFAAVGQLRVWFDANDLPYGYGWAPAMREAARDLAGLVSVVTDAYPTRPWCREEVRQARTPRREDSSTAQCSVWRVQPTVAVHQPGETWSRAMAQLAQVPAIGWPSDGREVANRMTHIVDRLMLEVLVTHFYLKKAQYIAADSGGNTSTHLALLTWIPEPWSLARVLAHIVDPGDSSNNQPEIGEIIVAYPGFGLRTREKTELDEVVECMQRFRGNRLGVRLVTQERLEDTLQRTHPLNLRVCLSGGGSDHEIEAAGVGMPHINDLFVRLARRLLEARCTLVYGGTLANLSDNLTVALIDAARGWIQDRNEANNCPATTAAQLDDPPFINYSAWPNTRYVKLQHRADLAGMCAFEQIYPPGAARPLPTDAAYRRSATGMTHAANALTAMREVTADPHHGFALRIVLGGKIANAAGWMPGIAEEVMCSLDADQLPIILGGFGGCAMLLADFLRSPDEQWPHELTFAGRRHDTSLAGLVSDKGRAIAEERFSRLKQSVEKFRQELHTDAKWRTSDVPCADILELLQQNGPTNAVNGVMRIARTVAEGSESH